MAGKRVPHPKEPEILALLREGVTNAEVVRRLNVPVRAVAQVRNDAGIPPAPRNAWRRRHPQERTIRLLLDEGYSDAAIRRRTGADPRAIARRRAEGGFGPATIRSRTARKHPKDAEIRSLLAAMSSEAIARTLGVDRAAVRRIRKEAGIVYVAPKYASPEEKWAAHVRAVDGGHLEWTGSRSTETDTPVIRFREKSVSPAALAFRMHTGRDPVGYAQAECGRQHCVAPGHVEDEPGRRRIREQLRCLKGTAQPAPVCRHGHDQAEHRLYEPDGTAYCGACKREQKQPDPSSPA